MRPLATTTLLGCAILLAGHPLAAQADRATPAPTPTPSIANVASRYARAESFLGRNARTLVYGAEVEPQWMADGRFWYRNRTRAGMEFVLVDPVRGTRAAAFDHARLAAALSVAAETTFAPGILPFERIRLEDGGRTLRVLTTRDREWSCDLSAYRCAGPSAPTDLKPDEVASPDGRLVAFVREENSSSSSSTPNGERRPASSYRRVPWSPPPAAARCSTACGRTCSGRATDGTCTSPPSRAGIGSWSCSTPTRPPGARAACCARRAPRTWS